MHEGMTTSLAPEESPNTCEYEIPSNNDQNPCDILQKLKGFRLGHLNITSLPKYIDQLQLYLHSEPLDVLSINETRLDEDITDLLININGYNVIRNDRNREGGGVAIYYRGCLNVRSRSELIPDGLEAVCIEVLQNKCKPLLVASVYRPPNALIEIFEKIELLMQNLDEENKEVIIFGDFNCDLLPVVKSHHTQKFLDLINIFQLKQMITQATRITTNTESLIDVALTNMPERITNSGVLHMGISDHCFIYICRKISFSKNRPKIVETRNYKNYIIDYFNNDLNYLLEQYNWESEDPNMLWGNFKNAFNEVANMHAPIRTRKVRSEYAPWLTESIKKQMNHRDYLKRKAVKTKSAYFHNAYKEMRNRVNKNIKNSKIQYYYKCIDENKGSSKKMWKSINQLIGRGSKTTHITSLSMGDEDITDESKIADELNKYFTRVGPDLANQIPKTNIKPEVYVKPFESIFTFKAILVNQVYSLLDKIDMSKSLGPDKIPGRLLKDSRSVIAPYLTQIFNVSIASGIFPDDWKVARVSPIHKSGDKTECGNYRPISVLSVVSKLFEKFVYKQLNDYLTNNNILSTHQSGFREGHSTATSMLTTTNSWLINMDSGLINGIIFLDLCKAFDTINHEILIRKLYLYGIRGAALKLFTSYLAQRTQICKINSVTSSPKPVECGVPQGSNLGPLLFLLYINDLPNCLNNSSVPAMYADDTNITTNGETIEKLEEKLNCELNNVHNWLIANKLTVNVSKTEYMVIGTRQRLSRNRYEPKIQIGGIDLKRVSTTKSLGVLVDENLNWHQQIDNISKKVSKGIGMLRRVKPYLSQQSLQTVYHSLILPHFDYCSLVWGNCNQSLKSKLQKLQNRAARVITGDTYDVRSYEILPKLGWKTLEERRDEQMASTVTKALNNECPPNITSMFEISNNTNYNLRSNNNMLMLSKPRTNAMKRSFSYAAAKIWNKLSSSNSN